MPDKRQESEFKVSDRRLFTADGELRSSEEQAKSESATEPTATTAAEKEPVAGAATVVDPEIADGAAPEPPTASEQQAQNEAYRESSRDLDRRVELSGHSAKALEVNFEQFMASLYMTSMMQLGLMHERGGQPTVDLIGARQTIDTLGLLAEKTKGNLTPKEQNFLQNALYELRMAYVEVTNALARGPQQASGAGPNVGPNFDPKSGPNFGPTGTNG